MAPAAMSPSTPPAGRASPRAPWWVLALAASFVCFYALLVYCDLRRPEDEGSHLRPARGGLVVDVVHAGSPAARAGLAAGDLIVAADGHRLTSRLEWSTTRANARLNVPTMLEVERGGRTRTLALANQPASWRRWTTQAGFGLLVAYLVQGVTLALGIFILLRRPDPVARLGAWLLGCLGVFVVALPARLFTVWRAFPGVAREAMWLPFAGSIVAAAVLLSFFLSFPVRRVRSRLVWAVVWLPAVAASVAPLRYYATALYFPDAPRPGSGQPLLLAVTVGYVVATVAVVLLGYGTLRKDDERRRVRVLAVAPVAACIAGLPAVVGYWTTAGPTLLFESPTVGVAAFLMLLVPLAFAYAILEHRLFDITFIVRQGVRYAVARRALLSLVPALVALMAVDLYAHRDQALAQVFATRGTVYLLLAAAALVAHRERDRVLDALDRRFFRERYDAQRLLATLGDELQEGVGFEAASVHTLERILAALHPSFAAILVRDGDGDFERLAAVPDGEGPATMPAGTKVVRLAFDLRKPVDLRGEEAELLVPLVASRTRPAEEGGDAREWRALMALGPKRSEEPYSGEDRNLLQAAARALASIAPRGSADTPASPGSPASPHPRPAVPMPRFSECPSCGRCFDETHTSCTADGAALVSSALPRLLLGRYRIDRRLGRGGMGIVYAASDESLGREVAVKVLRDELATDPRAADRFEREARLAAAFSHPNVVTVHDFGVAAGRGFLVMELLSGTSLRDALERDGRLTSARVIAVMGSICGAVEAAHRRGLVHRDLKPENIFLARSEGIETPKVLDFGISKIGAVAGAGAGRAMTASATPSAAVVPAGAFLAQTVAGALVGTPEYMAPEQIRAEAAQPAWDVWALAVIAFEMLAGRRPTPAGFSAAGGSPFLEERALPSATRSFFRRALAIDPGERPASARELHEGLTSALGGGADPR